MKKPLVTVLALLICLGAVLLALVFGYSRYRAAKARDAAFGAVLQNYTAPASGSAMPSAGAANTAGANANEVVTQVLTGHASNTSMSLRMPPQLSRAPREPEQNADADAAESNHSPSPH